MTEHELESQILDALNQLDAARSAQPRQDAFRDILERFARTLSKHRAIGAAVEDVPELPGGRRLVTWPKLRRDERTGMLNFARAGEVLVLLGQGRRELRTPEELEAYLAHDFLRGLSFPDTLARYEEMCAMPLGGFLRRGGPERGQPRGRARPPRPGRATQARRGGPRRLLDGQDSGTSAPGSAHVRSP